MTIEDPVPEAAASLHVEVLEHTASGRLSVKVAGELDVSSIGDFEEQMQKLAAEVDGPLRLSFDLADLSFMDSSGLRLLLSWSVIAADRGGEFSISACSRPVRRAIEIAGISEALALTE